MNKASEWAARLKDASWALEKVKNDGPMAFTLHIVGPAGLSLYVDDAGGPVLAITGVDKDMEYSLYGDYAQKRLLDMAGWIIATFGEGAATP